MVKLYIKIYYISKGFNVNLQNNIGQTSLHLASFGYPSMVHLLLNSLANVEIKDNKNNTCLYNSIKTNQIEIFKVLLKNKAELNLLNNDYMSPLHLAADLGRSNIVELMIKFGKNINLEIVGKQNQTPLFCNLCS